LQEQGSLAQEYAPAVNFNQENVIIFFININLQYIFFIQITSDQLNSDAAALRLVVLNNKYVLQQEVGVIDNNVPYICNIILISKKITY
jgi:hypothetical protein